MVNCDIRHINKSLVPLEGNNLTTAKKRTMSFPDSPLLRRLQSQNASQKNDLAESTQFMYRIHEAQNAGNMRGMRKSTLQGLMEVIGRKSIKIPGGRRESKLVIRSDFSRKPTTWNFPFD